MRGESGTTVGLAVATNLLHIQHRSGLSDAELERRADLGDRYLQKLRLGRIADPSYSLLVRLATACGVSLDHLVSGYNPVSVVVIPAAYYVAQHGLVNPLFVTALSVMAGELAAWSEINTPPLLPTMVYRRTPTLVRLVNLLDCAINLLVTNAEQNEVELKLWEAEFAILSATYTRLTDQHRQIVHSVANNMGVDVIKRSRPQYRLKIAWLIAEIRSLGEGQNKTLEGETIASGSGSLGSKVAARLVTIQRRIGVGDAELERQARIGRSYLQKLKQGAISDPGYKVVTQLATACGVGTYYLAGGNSNQQLELTPTPFYLARFGLTNPLYVQALERIAQLLAATTMKSAEDWAAQITTFGKHLNNLGAEQSKELTALRTTFMQLSASQREALRSAALALAAAQQR